MAITVIGGVYFGTKAADNLNGGSWNDTFHMTADDYVTDVVNGGAGSDTVDYSSSQIGLTVTLADPPLKGAQGRITVGRNRRGRLHQARL